MSGAVLEGTVYACAIFSAALSPSIAADTMPSATPAVLVVGPEGGFNDYEVTRLLEAGAVAGTLGPHILRTEVALPALLGRWL